ncbi:MAG: exodeoxyribonuclease VII small subunit [Clostridia bacterium]|nr:exodeoxyribonuclease VII small subunit [Clostridia bacterium]
MGKELKFEEAIKQLSEIVKALESGEVPLDESIALFEEGMKLSKQCTEILEKAEQKVRFLQQTESEIDE